MTSLEAGLKKKESKCKNAGLAVRQWNGEPRKHENWGRQVIFSKKWRKLFQTKPKVELKIALDYISKC